MQSQKTAVVIGAGAAGFFGAIALKQAFPAARVLILEKTGKILAKVSISGGGRCNLSHQYSTNKLFASNYPRGGRQLERAFNLFSPADTVAWFEKNGVPVYTQSDGRMFPVSDNSASVVNCLAGLANRLGIELIRQCGVRALAPQAAELGGGWLLETLENDTKKSIKADAVLVATGGASGAGSLAWLANLNLNIIAPAPSLFTFNTPKTVFEGLQGLSVENAAASVSGIAMVSKGPLLLTHWGLSGPAILKLSAWQARALEQLNYRFGCKIDWLPEVSEAELKNIFLDKRQKNPNKLIHNERPNSAIPARLWQRICDLAEVGPQTSWAQLPAKPQNRLADLLKRSMFDVSGKTTYKEEFVQAGGVALEEIDFSAMQARRYTGLYFAGEVLDIDGITGGFNFQAAWTTGYIAGIAIAAQFKVDLS